MRTVCVCLGDGRARLSALSLCSLPLGQPAVSHCLSRYTEGPLELICDPSHTSSPLGVPVSAKYCQTPVDPPSNVHIHIHRKHPSTKRGKKATSSSRAEPGASLTRSGRVTNDGVLAIDF
ncbi:hypothetical protein chiPu_0004291 [Chiloscyllium punctatum]|uniref:Uncharacterized protein n=1 Tax=Chiloscyllium punctatum TaxID=137246 RepID=A0A401S665_CHIPU|nr:hypothetical protein [Chiloscyllium punctatum]